MRATRTKIPPSRANQPSRNGRQSPSRIVRRDSENTRRPEKGCLEVLPRQPLGIPPREVQPHPVRTSLARDEGKEKAEAASGITGKRENPHPPRTSRGNSSTIQQVQTDRMGPIYRGGIVPKGTGTTVKSRMLLNSHCETLGVLMQVEGVALDLATEALVGARNTTCFSLFHLGPSRRPLARPAHIPPTPFQGSVRDSDQRLGKSSSRSDCIRNLGRIGSVFCALVNSQTLQVIGMARGTYQHTSHSCPDRVHLCSSLPGHARWRR